MDQVEAFALSNSDEKQKGQMGKTKSNLESRGMRLEETEAWEKEANLSGEGSGATDILLGLTVNGRNREENLETSLDDDHAISQRLLLSLSLLFS